MGSGLRFSGFLLLVGTLPVENRKTEGMTPDPFERRAIVETRNGDAGAYDYLVTKYGRKALAIASGLLRNREDAEDVAQEAFVRAFRSIRRFKEDQPFGPWLFRIVTNLTLDQLRRRKHYDTAELPELNAPDDSSVSAEQRELGNMINRAIQSLPEMQRAVAHLVLVEEFSQAEAASMLGISDGTVRSHLSLGRAKLKEALNEYRRR